MDCHTPPLHQAMTPTEQQEDSEAVFVETYGGIEVRATYYDAQLWYGGRLLLKVPGTYGKPNLKISARRSKNRLFNEGLGKVYARNIFNGTDKPNHAVWLLRSKHSTK